MPDDGNYRQPFGLSSAPRLPPSNVQAEQALLGSLLSNNSRSADRCQFLRPEHFADPVNGRIFARAMERISVGQVADVLTLKTDFENTEMLADVGGTAYLVKLIPAGVSWMVVGDYAKTIYDTWLRRQLIDVGEQIVNEAFGLDPAADATKMVDQAAEAVLSLGERSSPTGGASLDAALDAAIDAAQATHRGNGINGLMTGIPSLDDLWRGLWPQSFDILGARSKHGKTALVMQSAQAVATQLRTDWEASGRQGPLGHVLFFSLEMSAENLALRMLASETGIPAHEIRAGKIAGARAELLLQARRRLRDLPLLIHDKKGTTLSELRMTTRVAKRQKNVRWVIADHIHIIRPDAAMYRLPRLDQVRQIAESLKELADTLSIPVTGLAQLKADVESRDDHRPRTSDIEYIGERDADNVILLWQPQLYDRGSPPAMSDRLSEEKKAEAFAAWHRQREQMAGKAEVILAKSRMGPGGSAWLQFDGPRMRFSDLPSDSYEAGLF